jgi:hypothetical protein
MPEGRNHLRISIIFGRPKSIIFLSFKFVSHVNELIFFHYFCAGIEIQEVRNSWAFGENGMTRHTASVWEKS